MALARRVHPYLRSAPGRAETCHAAVDGRTLRGT
ncbi:MAG: hypothetical protein EBR07_08455 [Planctomycetes bacterium]|nr:hypothetical protein [Planctomycetota bacterium]